MFGKIISRIKIKLKQKSCKHEHKETTYKYLEGFTYNEHFDCAQTTRNRLIICSDCGKVLNSLVVEWISHEQIYQELREEYIKKNGIPKKLRKKVE